MSSDRWVDKEAVARIHSGILLTHKKEQIWIHWTEVNESKACYTEWSKSEREKISHINAHIWNLENDIDEPICKEGMETQM